MLAQTSSPRRTLIATYDPAALGLQNISVGVRQKMNQSDTCRFETQKVYFSHQVQRNKRDVLQRGFHATEKKKKKNGDGERGAEKGEKGGGVFIGPALGASSLKAVAIENGHAGLSGQLLYLLTPAGGSDTVGSPPPPAPKAGAPVLFPSLTPVQSHHWLHQSSSATLPVLFKNGDK